MKFSSIFLALCLTFVLCNCAGKPVITEKSPEWFKDRFSQTRRAYPNMCLAPRELLNRADRIDWDQFAKNLHMTSEALLLFDDRLLPHEINPEQWLAQQMERLQERSID